MEIPFTHTLHYENKIVLRCIQFLYFLFFVFTNFSDGSQSFGGCFWSACVNKRNVSSKLLCGPEIGTARMKQGCLNNDSKGLKYLCCSSLKSKCSAPAANDDNSNITWWQNYEGEPTVVEIDCPMIPLGEHIDDLIIQFFLYTKNNNNPSDYKKIKIGDRKGLMRSGFIKDAPVKLIIHGFLANSIFGPLPFLRKYYLLNNATVNIISVDWEIVAGLPCHNKAAAFGRIVAEKSALLLKFLLSEKMVELQDIHVIGHSLGAHVAGFTGKRFFEYTGTKIPRITGLDPSAPTFEKKGPADRIDRSDADFVDIIHTTITPRTVFIGFLSKITVGFPEPVGHADFYPNKGGDQPGCEALDRVFAICSHTRAIELFAESIQPPSNAVFRGTLCKDYNEARNGNCRGSKTTLMGASTDINNSSSHIYSLETNRKSPYAKDRRKSSDYQFCSIP